MIRRFIIAFVLVVLVCGGIVGFNLFRDQAIQDFFANMPVAPVTVSTIKVEPIEWTPGIEAIGTVAAARGSNRTDRLDAGRPLNRLDLDRRHGDRSDRHVGEKVLDCLVAEQVEADDSAANQDNEHKSDDEATNHFPERRWWAKVAGTAMLPEPMAV